MKLYIVGGFITSNRRWHPDSIFDTREKAEERVNQLNRLWDQKEQNNENGLYSSDVEAYEFEMPKTYIELMALFDLFEEYNYIQGYPEDSELHDEYPDQVDVAEAQDYIFQHRIIPPSKGE